MPNNYGLSDEEFEKRLRALYMTEDSADPNGFNKFIQGYNDALWTMIALALGKHRIIDCCNYHCSAPLKNMHCVDCEELEIEYDREHVWEYADESDRAHILKRAHDEALRVNDSY